jgi:hypothetical protein
MYNLRLCHWGEIGIGVRGVLRYVGEMECAGVVMDAWLRMGNTDEMNFRLHRRRGVATSPERLSASQDGLLTMELLSFVLRLLFELSVLFLSLPFR